MSRTPNTSAPTISLFPFLAVLLCTMGALLVLLVIFSNAARHGDSREAARAAEALEQELEAARDDLAWRSEQLAGIRDRTAADLATARLQLAGVEENNRAIEDEIARLERKAAALSADVAPVADAARLDAELEARLKSARESLDKALAERRSRPPAYAVVPYAGRSGTHRRPLYIECCGDGVFLQPEGIRLNPSDFEGPPGPGNPLASALRAAREHVVATTGGANDPGRQPYPLLLVRPSGVMAYYAARESIQSWGSDFGYQLIDEDWTLTFPPADPTLAQVERRAIDEARQRLAWLAEVRPVRQARPPQQYRAAPTRGGVVADGGPSVLGDQSRWEWSQGRRGAGTGAGVGGGTGSGGNTAGGSGTGGSGTGDSTGDLAGQGGAAGGFGGAGPDGPQSGGSRGTGPGQASNTADGGPRPGWNGGVANGGQPGARFAGQSNAGGDAAGGQAINGGRPGAAGTAAEGAATASSSAEQSHVAGATSAGGQGGSALAATAGGKGAGGGADGSADPWATSGGGSAGGGNGPALPGLAQSGGGGSSGQPQGGSGASASVSLSQSRGKDWASLATRDRPVGITRPIRIECAQQEFRILDESGRRVERRISIDGDTAAAVDPLVQAVHAKVENWGIAGERMYWRPQLVLSETADGRGRRQDLERLLADSGIDTRSLDRNDQILPLPPVERSAALVPHR